MSIKLLNGQAVWDLMSVTPAGPGDVVTLPPIGLNVKSLAGGGAIYISTPDGQWVTHGFAGVPRIVATAENPGDVVTVTNVDSNKFLIKISNCYGVAKAQWIEWVGVLKYT